jgi:selenocysteine lyase/cysteine desulfurase
MSLIDEQTAVIVLSHVEYVNGQRYDLESFSKAAQEVDALLITDATQSMGMVPIDAPNSGVDAMVASGYKWLRGSFGAAVGYVSPRLRGLNPGLVGFRSHTDMWDMRPDRVVLPQDASRFEYTTLHFGAALGLAEAIKEIDAFGIDEVWEHDLALADLIVSEAKGLGFDIASPTNEAERSAIVSLRPPEGFDSNALASALQDDQGIIVSSRSGLIRVSPHIDNVPDDIARLISALGNLLP